MSGGLFPSACRQCGERFDLGSAIVTGRYADCDVFKTPCCGAVCDTRTRWGQPAWAKNGYDDIRAYERIEGESYEAPRWYGGVVR